MGEAEEPDLGLPDAFPPSRLPGSQGVIPTPGVGVGTSSTPQGGEEGRSGPRGGHEATCVTDLQSTFSVCYCASESLLEATTQI